MHKMSFSALAKEYGVPSARIRRMRKLGVFDVLGIDVLRDDGNYFIDREALEEVEDEFVIYCIDNDSLNSLRDVISPKDVFDAIGVIKTPENVVHLTTIAGVMGYLTSTLGDFVYGRGILDETDSILEFLEADVEGRSGIIYRRVQESSNGSIDYDSMTACEALRILGMLFYDIPMILLAESVTHSYKNFVNDPRKISYPALRIIGNDFKKRYFYGKIKGEWPHERRWGENGAVDVNVRKLRLISAGYVGKSGLFVLDEQQRKLIETIVDETKDRFPEDFGVEILGVYDVINCPTKPSLVKVGFSVYDVKDGIWIDNNGKKSYGLVRDNSIMRFREVGNS